MKKILGVDLGTTSIGWAYVKEAEKEKEESSIEKLGVRIHQLDNFDTVNKKKGIVSESKNPIKDFAEGKGLSPNARRTKSRGMRRNLQRYKQRRSALIEILKKHKFIDKESKLIEVGENTTFQTLKLRAKAAKQKIEKLELARVLLTINKKRGYKSNRKAKSEEEGEAIDGMEVAKKLYEENLTPGQYCYQLLEKGKKILPDFYRSDLQREFDTVWKCQKEYHPEKLSDELLKELEGKGSKATWAICAKTFYLVEVKRTTKGQALKKENYHWRTLALAEELDLEKLAVVLQEINNNLNSSSGYLGAISDRSKELYFEKETVGEYLYKQIDNNPHTRLKGQVFYRQDYLDEFEKIWETQKKHHSELTDELKVAIRDVIIFYQRRLKSQKGLISFCEFESKQIEIEVNGYKKTKTIGLRVCSKSSPLFQEFKIWQNLSNLIIKNKKTKAEFGSKSKSKNQKKINFQEDISEEFVFNIETKELLFKELNIKGNLEKKDVLKLLGLDKNEWDINYKKLEGNRTNEAFFKAYGKILEHSGHQANFKKLNAKKTIKAVHEVFEHLGIDTDILYFNAELEGKEFEKQKSYQFWHLLYSYEGDNSNTGNEALYNKLKTTFGIEKEYAQYLININLQDDYGSLSTKAIRKIFPYIKENDFSDASALAGYNHSHSLTKEENEGRYLKEKLDPVQKNSLRNPVVEKILNQMVNVINTIIEDPSLGKPDEIRIELARELKKSAKEREEMTKGINDANKKHEEYRKILNDEFDLLNPTHKDIIKYKLYIELENNGHKTLYSNKYISKGQLFSKEIEVEHIIPKARLFDDSFSNKTLEYSEYNKEKGEETAYDYIENKFGEEKLKKYVSKIEKLHKDKILSTAKKNKLLMKSSEIGEGFIERDLRESQYIAKKAKQMLLELCRTVVSTSGKITDRLREDWGLIDTMKELNIEKYRSLGLTEWEERKDGNKVEKITDWTKRNDHRHHAMDALTVAFTKHNHIQYLNNLNARKNEDDEKYGSIKGIEKKETYKKMGKNGKEKRVFRTPTLHFRAEAKKHLEGILISHKAKNKVVTKNKNKIEGSSKIQKALTPRGQMHKETIYGKSQKYVTKEVNIGTRFDEAMIAKVGNKKYREALQLRLNQNEGNPKKAFGGKNSPTKKPILTSDNKPLPKKIKLVWQENIYTIRKEISPDLKLDKVIDGGIREILKKRLKEFNGKPKEAFSNLEENPIWLNEEKGIAIKRVSIKGVSSAEPLHYKKNYLGNFILNENDEKIAVDYVSTGNNHHVAIYKDEKGNLHEEVVSFYEAVARANAEPKLPIINKSHEKGWEFLFTMKQNEMFVFPPDDFDPNEMELTDPKNTHLISPHLFRVQKIGSLLSGFWFRHHLETRVDKINIEVKNILFKRIQKNSDLENVIKVRINHIGQIVQIGEY